MSDTVKKSVAAIAHKGRRIFVAHRLPTGDMGGRWEFPGGKVEPGESCQEAIKREMQEEFGADVEVGQRIAEGRFCHRGQERILEAYSISFAPGVDTAHLALTEHSECEWVDADAIASLPFVDSDMMIYPQVKQWLGQEGEAK